MKAIIIQDADASNLLDLLKLEKFEGPAMYNSSGIEAWNSLPETTRDYLLGQMHRKFHYIVCRWLQEQGATCIR